MPSPLVVIPTYVTEEKDLEVTLDTVRSIRKTVSESVDILLVDDGSPSAKLIRSLVTGSERLGAEFVSKGENSGFAKTVNVGLRRALNEERDAVLMNADMEMRTPGWVKICQKTKDSKGRPAGVVGALLVYPTGLIQHGGIYFSLLTRQFDHMYKYGPQNLPEAHAPSIRPVTGAFQYIRHSTLAKVGVYDENFFMAHEDVDFCIRVFLAELECVYNPKVSAFHFEQMFRGRQSPKLRDWHAKSWDYFVDKWKDQSFLGLVPNL